jgi:hypothetical protein
MTGLVAVPAPAEVERAAAAVVPDPGGSDHGVPEILVNGAEGPPKVPGPVPQRPTGDNFRTSFLVVVGFRGS